MAFPISEEQLRLAEKELGVSLPGSLRQRLLEENGGEIQADGLIWELFPVQDDGDRKRLARTANHILRETQEARAWDGFPPNAVAIASNGIGDLLILQPESGGQLSEVVLLWQHETNEVSPVDVDWKV